MELKSEEQLYIEMLKEQIVEQARYIDEVREVKHDMYAHMMVLRHYLSVKEYPKAQTYLEKLMQIPLFRKGSYVDVGNDMVNALLSTRIATSEKKIELSTSGLLPEKFWMDDMDLCILFSNVVSNCVEACERLTYCEKEITLRIEEELQGISICFANPIEQEIDEGEFGKSTSKEDKKNHGYGMRNIKRIVDKYHGDIKMQFSAGLVLVKITLPYIV